MSFLGNWICRNKIRICNCTFDSATTITGKCSPIWVSRLKALISIPKVQPRYALAIWKKYPTLKSLLLVYMDTTKTVSLLSIFLVFPYTEYVGDVLLLASVFPTISWNVNIWKLEVRKSHNYGSPKIGCTF